MFVKTPGILIRMGNLILIQVLFIFAALIIVLFDGGHETLFDVGALGQKPELTQVARVASYLVKPASVKPRTETDLLPELRDGLNRIKGIDCAAIMRLAEDRSIAVEFPYYSDDFASTEQGEGLNVAQFYDPTMLRFIASADPGFTMSSLYSSLHSVLYRRLETSAGDYPAVLVIVIRHGLVVSPESQLQYVVLLLFLASALLSLLIIYLLKRQFKQPLDRLIRGLEKTAQGEQYHMIETKEDPELRRLVTAFNLMSQRLWDNHRELRHYNIRLKKTNISLLQSQVFLATLIENTPLGILVSDPEGRIMISNQAASDLFGYTSSELIAEPIEVLFADPHGQSLSIIEYESEYSDNEVICRRKDGKHFPAYIIATALQTEQGQNNANLYILRDISESKSFQDMMIRLDRYYTRGEMAGDIAHEINNYLAVLLGNLELMPILLKKGDSEKIDKKLDLMKSTVDRVARFANGLMDAPQDDADFESVSINQLVENIIAFLKPQNKFDNIQITTKLSPEILVLQADPGQIQQLLVNLIYNAADALYDNEGEKRIEIATLLSIVDNDKFATIEVRDNGPGVLPEKENLLFSNRFTTKRKGHGIGLITCRKLIDNHGGSIGYRTEDGAIFYFHLPLKARVPTQKEQESTESMDRAPAT